MAEITVFGIPTCDTCRKAQKALAADGHDVVLRDVRSDPLTADERAALISAFADDIVNRRSTTYRGMSDAERQRPAADILAAFPTVMKRPVLRAGDRMTLGWSDAIRASWS